jgi:hypothetical protein
MPEAAIQKRVLPQLLKVCEKSQDLEYVVMALNCVVFCLAKVNHNRFMKYLILKFKDIWKLHSEPIIIQCLAKLFIALRGTDVPTMAYAIPFAAEIARDPTCDPYHQRLLVSWMLAFVTKFKSSSHIDEAEDPKPKQSEAPPAELTAVFDPLAEQLNFTPGQQTFDFGVQQPVQSQLMSLI